MPEAFSHLPWLSRQAQGLCAEAVPLAELASRYGTPAWVYSKQALETSWQAFSEALRDQYALVCYAVKANSNLSILRFFSEAGAGFDIVSGGELARVLRAGGCASKIVFSGVGKRSDEILDALRAGVKCFNVESEAELLRINATALDLGLRAPISLRINPDVDAKSHPYISTGLKENKFGIDQQEALRLYRQATQLPGLEVIGIDCHIGSQITEMSPFLAALERLLELIEQLHADGIRLKHLDLGGGLGIRYVDETPPSAAQFMKAIVERLNSHHLTRDMELIFEFGRALVGNAGLLLTRVEYLKQNGDRHFAVVDAAMNDLIRPALYDGYHPIIEVLPAPGEPKVYDVVGPVCESGDWLGKARLLRLEAENGLLAILSTGAYGMSMSSNYNARPRAVELMVEGASLRVIRERETIASLWQGEI